MKTSTMLLTTLLAAPATAQQIPIYIDVFFPVNQVANPSFEDATLGPSWVDWGSYVSPGKSTVAYSPVTSWAFGGLTGSHSFMAATGESAATHRALSQRFTYPVPVAYVTEASFNYYASGGSMAWPVLGVEIDYTDAAPSYSTLSVESGYGTGWRYVDFRSALRPGKTISRIVVWADTYFGNGHRIYIDDVKLTLPFIFTHF